jgi:aspartyl protease family protein
VRRNGFLLLVLLLMAVAVGVLALNDGGRIAGLRDDDFGRAAYAGIFGLVLAAGLFGAFRGNLAGAVKGLLTWALAFAVLVAVYSFRQEFREIGDRILSELIPGHVITVAGDGTQVRVLRADDAHFHVDAVVNGKSVSFLVDTGASLVALDRGTAEGVGIDVASLGFTTRVMTANGPARAAPVKLAYIKIGDIVRENVQAAVMDSDGDGLSLLGMSFLGTLSSFDFRGERLTLTD